MGLTISLKSNHNVTRNILQNILCIDKYLFKSTQLYHNEMVTVCMPREQVCHGMRNIYCDHINKIFGTLVKNSQLGAKVGEMVPWGQHCPESTRSNDNAQELSRKLVKAE